MNSYGLGHVHVYHKLLGTCVRIHVHLYVLCSLCTYTCTCTSVCVMFSVGPVHICMHESSRSVFLYHSYKRSHGGEAAIKRLALCRLTWEQCSCGVAVQARVHVLPLFCAQKGSVLASVDVHMYM